jgi:hypothetical protein
MRGRYDGTGGPYPYFFNGQWQGYRYFFFTSAMISCKYYFPINSFYQIKMKAFPGNHDNGTQMVLYGGNNSEIDLLETYTNSVDTNLVHAEVQSMGVHAKEYGSGTYRAEYSDMYHAYNLQQTLNEYSLIWDKWKCEFYFNNEGIDGIVNQVCKYYAISGSTSTVYRTNPIGNYTAFSNAYYAGANFGVLKNYPDYTPMRLYLGFGIRGGSDYSQYTASNTMDIDHVYVWLRANCSSNYTDTVKSIVYTGEPSNIKTAYQLGYNVLTQPSTTLELIPGHNAVFAAVNEIALQDGFNADADCNFAAFITTCISTWDAKQMNSSPEPNFGSSISEVSSTVPADNDENSVMSSGEQVNIISRQNNFISYELYDAMGNLLKKETGLNSMRIDLNKNNFATGIYYLRLEKASGFDMKRIFIQN